MLKIRGITVSTSNASCSQRQHPTIVAEQNMASTNNMAQHYKPDIDSPTVRLMVLETDRPHPDTESERGSFGAILHHHFSKAGRAHHPPLGVQTDQVFVVTEEGGRIPTVDEFRDHDGLLITGSMYDAYGDNQWILDLLALLQGASGPTMSSCPGSHILRGSRLTDKPAMTELWLTRPDFHFTGVCFGHQLLARLLGATVAPAPGGMLDADAEVACWGRSEHTPIQGLYIPNRLFTTQAHLAFDEDMVRRQIQMRVDSGGIKDLEHADRAAETAHLEHDGVEVAKAILRLFVYDDDGMGYERR